MQAHDCKRLTGSTTKAAASRISSSHMLKTIGMEELVVITIKHLHMKGGGGMGVFDSERHRLPHTNILST